MQATEAPAGAASNALPISLRDPKYVAPQLGRVLDFVLRRRITLSAALFVGLGTRDIVVGVAPHNLTVFTDAVTIVGLVAVLAGLAIRSWAAGFLIKDDQLTTTGPYAVARNPLYLGSFLMVLGFCTLIHDGVNLAVMAILLPCLYIPKVLNEERTLAGRYPGAWPRYAASTSRFFPRRLVWPALSGWRKSQWLQSREYNAVLAVAGGLALLKYLHSIHV